MCLFNCQRKNKKIIYANVYRNTINDGDSQTSPLPIFPEGGGTSVHRLTDEQLGHVDIVFSNYYNLQSVRTLNSQIVCVQTPPIICTEAHTTNVVKSYIALRSFVFLFNSLIFLPVFDNYHSCLVLEFLPDLIGEYKEFFTELFHSFFSHFVVAFFNTLGGTIT